jgi:CHAD domain-containing protein
LTIPSLHEELAIPDVEFGMKLKKWLELKSKREAITPVVKRILRSRVTAVVHFMSLVIKRNTMQMGKLHRLRVWCRRTEAALKLCRKFLPKSSTDKLLQQLRKIRRTAGVLRDIRLLQQHIEKKCKGALRAYLLNQIHLQRTTAESSFKRFVKKLQGGQKLNRLQRKMEHHLQDKRKQKSFKKPFVKWCEQRLTKWVERFIAGVGPETADLRRWHKYRIAGKRLRYAWEVSAGVAAISQRKMWCERLALMQSELGELIDTANRVEQLQAAYDGAPNRAVRSQLLRVIRSEEAALTLGLEKWNQQTPIIATTQDENAASTAPTSPILPLSQKIRRSKSQG